MMKKYIESCLLFLFCYQTATEIVTSTLKLKRSINAFSPDWTT